MSLSEAFATHEQRLLKILNTFKAAQARLTKMLAGINTKPTCMDADTSDGHNLCVGCEWQSGETVVVELYADMNKNRIAITLEDISQSQFLDGPFSYDYVVGEDLSEEECVRRINKVLQYFEL